MVDRITPAVTPDDVKRLDAQSGVEDAAPVYSEDFIQWVIEDDFIAGRPDWEAVGVEFTDNVSAYENMKLSLLNASHSLLSYPAFLAGYRRVDEAVGDERFARYLRLFMDGTRALRSASRGIRIWSCTRRPCWSASATRR